jgi:hypothetical protein
MMHLKVQSVCICDALVQAAEWRRARLRNRIGSAVATHATRLGEKLRREGLGTDHITVFYHTSGHDRG